MSRGRLITLEGGEGAGKSTLAAGLEAALKRAGVPVVRTREPGGSTGADQIRALLVTGDGDRWSSLTETLLLAAARNDHLERLVTPALARGDWVICDRFTDSTIAYQAAGRGVSLETIATLHRAIGAPTPDLTLILDLDVASGLARAKSRAGAEERFEGLDTAFHERVRRSFLDTAAREPTRCAVIDATQGPDAVLAQACAVIAQRLQISL